MITPAHDMYVSVYQHNIFVERKDFSTYLCYHSYIGMYMCCTSCMYILSSFTSWYMVFITQTTEWKFLLLHLPHQIQFTTCALFHEDRVCVCVCSVLQIHFIVRFKHPVTGVIEVWCHHDLWWHPKPHLHFVLQEKHCKQPEKELDFFNDRRTHLFSLCECSAPAVPASLV